MTCHYKYFLLNLSQIDKAALSSVNVCMYCLGPDLMLCHHKHCLVAISKQKISIVHMAACTLTIPLITDQ